MALAFQKVTTSNTARNVFVTFVKPNLVQRLKPKPPNTFQTYFMEEYSIVEIPPPPYCSICNKYITDTYCHSVMKPDYCPYKIKIP